ncbi:MAG: DUF3311 domain-containing protein [Actinobacteria bacterium]|jgi:hypothetical protein|nr:DUF3311 domain-containing protein [Actinomycetota bacterium]
MGTVSSGATGNGPLEQEESGITHPNTDGTQIEPDHLACSDHGDVACPDSPSDDMGTHGSDHQFTPLSQHRPRSLWLLLIPLVPVAIPAFYSRIHPTLVGIPFFVWYQMTAVVFGGIVTGVVYLLRGTESRLAGEWDRGQDRRQEP